jgi:hypothetical protein
MYIHHFILMKSYPRLMLSSNLPIRNHVHLTIQESSNFQLFQHFLVPRIIKLDESSSDLILIGTMLGSARKAFIDVDCGRFLIGRYMLKGQSEGCRLGMFEMFMRSFKYYA